MTKNKGRVIIRVTTLFSFFSILFLALFALSGCNTMHGIGIMIEGVGKDIRGFTDGDVEGYDPSERFSNR
jgi:predicted small secreted protein